jgi:hypothetical protein
MNSFEQDRDPRPSGDLPLVNGSVSQSAALLVTEVQNVLALVALPWERDLGARPELRSVRAGVRGHLAVAVHPDSLADVLMVLGELVANAYQHTTTPRRLRVFREGCSVHVEVTDGDPAEPRLLPSSPTRPSGHGLLIVDELCLEWGVRPALDGGPGKTVWAVLAGHLAC